MKLYWTCLNTIALTLVAAASQAIAAADELNPGSSEAGVYVGGYSGGGDATVGGNYAYAIKPRLLLVGEGGFITFGGYNFGYASGVSYSTHAFEAGANVHYLFSLSNEKLTPYVLGGFGILNYGASVSTSGYSASASVTATGANVGGGLRWQVGKNWGIRPELKYLLGNYHYGRFTIGAYYEFGK